MVKLKLAHTSAPISSSLVPPAQQPAIAPSTHPQQPSKSISMGLAFQPGYMPKPRRLVLSEEELREAEALAVATVETANGGVDRNKRARVAMDSSNAYYAEQAKLAAQVRRSQPGIGK